MYPRLSYVISFQIEVRKVQRDFELSRRYYFPYATFVSGIQVRKRRARYRTVGRLDDAAASVCNRRKTRYGRIKRGEEIRRQNYAAG